jgi:hypothetical protein
MGTKTFKTCYSILYPFTWSLIIFEKLLSVKNETCNDSIIDCLNVAWAGFFAGGVLESLRMLEKHIRKACHTESNLFKNLVVAGSYCYMVFLFGLTIIFAILLSIIDEVCQEVGDLLWAVVIFNGISCFFVIVGLVIGDKPKRPENRESMLDLDPPQQKEEYLSLNWA